MINRILVITLATTGLLTSLHIYAAQRFTPSLVYGTEIIPCLRTASGNPVIENWLQGWISAKFNVNFTSYRNVRAAVHYSWTGQYVPDDRWTTAMRWEYSCDGTVLDTRTETLASNTSLPTHWGVLLPLKETLLGPGGSCEANFYIETKSSRSANVCSGWSHLGTIDLTEENIGLDPQMNFTMTMPGEIPFDFSKMTLASVRHGLNYEATSRVSALFSFDRCMIDAAGTSCAIPYGNTNARLTVVRSDGAPVSLRTAASLGLGEIRILIERDGGEMDPATITINGRVVLSMD